MHIQLRIHRNRSCSRVAWLLSKPMLHVPGRQEKELQGKVQREDGTLAADWSS